MSGAQGAHVQIIERGGDANSVVVPNAVIINGQEILIPEDSEITVSPITGKDVVTVTLTMFVASLSVEPTSSL